MKLNFCYSDHIQLSESLSELGQKTRITQLDQGDGQYTMSFEQFSGVALAEIHSTNHCYMRDGVQLGRLTSIGLHQPINQTILSAFARGMR